MQGEEDPPTISLLRKQDAIRNAGARCSNFINVTV